MTARERRGCDPRNGNTTSQRPKMSLAGISSVVKYYPPKISSVVHRSLQKCEIVVFVRLSSEVYLDQGVKSWKKYNI